jgi:transposase
MFSGHIFVGFVPQEIQLQNVGLSREMVALSAPPPLGIPFILSHPVFSTFNLDQPLHMRVQLPFTTLKLNIIGWVILFIHWIQVALANLHHTRMYLKDNEKVQIITLSERGLKKAQVAKELSLNIKTVTRWIKRFESEGSLNVVTKGRGRKPSLTKEQSRTCVALLLGGKHSGASSVSLEIQKQFGIKVSAKTICRHAKLVSRMDGAPIKVVRSAPVKELSAGTVQKRVAFCKANKTKGWSTTMFTDRKKFHFNFPGAKVHQVAWVKVGSQRVAPRVNHAMVVNMYAGITKFGVTKPHLVAGTSKHKSIYFNKKGQTSKNITGHEYKDVVLNTFLPDRGQEDLFCSRNIVMGITAGQ